MNQPWKLPEDDAPQMPLGVGEHGDSDGFAGEDSAEPSPKAGKKLDTASAVMFGLFAAGVGMIYILGIQARPPKANAAMVASDARLNRQIAQLLGKSPLRTGDLSLTKKTDRLIKMFYSYPGTASPPARVLRSDPFALRVTRVAVRHLTIDDAAAVRRRRLAALARSFAGLRLQSILYSSDSATAMINDRLVQTGSKIGGFTVLTVEPNKVVLGSGKRKFALRLRAD